MFSFALSWVKLQRIIIPVYNGAGEKHHEIGSCLDNVKYPHWFVTCISSRILIISCLFLFPEPSILLARGRRQNSRARGATISGMHCRCRLRETGWAEFGYFLCYFKMVAPRALVFRSLIKLKMRAFVSVNNARVEFVRQVVWNGKIIGRVCLFSPFESGNPSSLF